MDYLVRVLQQGDGSLIILHPAMNDLARPPGLSDDAWALDRLNLTIGKHPEWQGLPSVDIRRDALPSDRTARHKWRLTGGAVIVDPAVPNPPHPRQTLFDEIDGTSSLAELKTVLKHIVRSI